LLPASATYKLTMTVTFPNGSYEPCIVYSTCTNCYNTGECQSAKQNFTLNAYTFRNMTKFGTLLEYQCPIAREFYVTETSTVKNQNITCLWNQTWSPGVTFPTCVCKICLKY